MCVSTGSFKIHLDPRSTMCLSWPSEPSWRRIRSGRSGCLPPWRLARRWRPRARADERAFSHPAILPPRHHLGRRLLRANDHHHRSAVSGWRPLGRAALRGHGGELSRRRDLGRGTVPGGCGGFASCRNRQDGFDVRWALLVTPSGRRRALRRSLNDGGARLAARERRKAKPGLALGLAGRGQRWRTRVPPLRAVLAARALPTGRRTTRLARRSCRRCHLDRRTRKRAGTARRRVRSQPRH